MFSIQEDESIFLSKIVALFTASVLLSSWLAQLPLQQESQAVDSMCFEKTSLQPIVERLSKEDYSPPPVEESPLVTVECSVPPVDTSFKSYTDYRCITDRTSPQWKIREQCFTDADGMRRIEAPNGDLDYIVALGSAYTTTVGDRFIFTLETGVSFTATVGDLKQDQHTDPSHRYIEQDGNVAEFHIDTDAVSARVIQMGDVSFAANLQGKIAKIEKIIERF